MQYKGEIKNFPPEVVEKMLERQVEQGNKRDVGVFEKGLTLRVHGGGFDWMDSPEGHDFWREVIEFENFDLFFEKYPKQPAFDLEKVLSGEHEAFTQCGDKVTELNLFKATNLQFPLYGILDQEVQCWNKEGKYYNGPQKDEWDLISKPAEKSCKETWVNLYFLHDSISIGSFFTNEKEAKEQGSTSSAYIKTIKLNDLL